MDLVEKILDIPPDGDSGTLEFLLFLIPVMGIYILCRMGSPKGKRSVRSHF